MEANGIGRIMATDLNENKMFCNISLGVTFIFVGIFYHNHPKLQKPVSGGEAL